MPPLIEIDNLSYRYPGAERDALQGLSLSIEAGTVTSILGPNGSGKTTLLSLILGLREPTSGKIGGTLYGGDGDRHRARSDASSTEPAQRGKRVGLVPQDETFPLGFAVFDYVLLGRAPHLGLLQRPKAQDYDIAAASIARVGLSALNQRQISSLSGGERQLAVIARALAQEPRLLLMDEPGAHLDLANKAVVLDLVRSLTDDGVTVLLTTHDPNAAAEISDGALLMREGRTMAQGALHEVFTGCNLSTTYGLAVEVVAVGERLMVLPGR